MAKVIGEIHEKGDTGKSFKSAAIEQCSTAGGKLEKLVEQLLKT